MAAVNLGPDALAEHTLQLLAPHHTEPLSYPLPLPS